MIVKMISAEAPVLFAKACELFILDLTMRAWAHTDDNKRRTLQVHILAFIHSFIASPVPLILSMISI
jgi:hypothetical protein